MPGPICYVAACSCPGSLSSLLGPEMARAGLKRLKPLSHIHAALNPEPNSAFGKVAALEASLYMRNQLLRDTDWASMAHSLEVRVPLVDSTLLRCVTSGDSWWQVRWQSRMLANSPHVPLPAAVTLAAKDRLCNAGASLVGAG